MCYMEWDEEKMSVRHYNIDKQHKHLVELVNKLHDYMKKGKGGDIIDEILNELLEYTMYHFGEEEKVMMECKVPTGEYSMHVLEHRFFIDTVKNFIENSNGKKSLVSIKTLNFLKGWLQIHILKTDQQYKKYIEKCKQGGESGDK